MSLHTAAAKDSLISPLAGLDGLFDALISHRPGSGGAPIDVYRRGEDVWVHVDLPGVSADSIDIDVERNVVTITAERKWAPVEGDKIYRSERQQGVVRRQLHLRQELDTEAIEADYHDGVLTLRIPVAEKAKARKITVKSTNPDPTGSSTESSAGSAVSGSTSETATAGEAAAAE